MALTRVDTGLQSFPDFNRNQQLANAQIYIGVPGLDPAILANQYQAYVVQENGTQVAVPQPIRTSAGGVPTYLGSPVQIGINEVSYSFKVLNSLGGQIYYIPDSSALANFVSNASAIVYDPQGIGAVQTTVERELNSQVVNVFRFMTAAQIADVEAGTLAIDVTSAIQAAIDWASVFLSTSRGEVYFPKGRYLIAGLNLHSRVILTGPGELNPTGVGAVAITMNNTISAAIYDLSIYLTNTNQKAIAILGTAGSFSQLNNFYNVKIDGTIPAGSVGIEINDSFSNSFFGCNVLRVASAVTFTNRANANHFYGGELRSNAANANGSFVIIHESTCLSNGFHGTVIENQRLPINMNGGVLAIDSGCYIEAFNSAQCIQMNGGDLKVLGSYFNSGFIFINGGNSITINDNTFDGLLSNANYPFIQYRADVATRLNCKGNGVLDTTTPGVLARPRDYFNGVSFVSRAIGNRVEFIENKPVRFQARLAADRTDVTGDGTIYVVDFGANEQFDDGSNFATTTFTAPENGVYMLNILLWVSGLVAVNHDDLTVTIVTSNRFYQVYQQNADLFTTAGRVSLCGAALVDMEAGDTAQIQVRVTGTAKVVDILRGDATNGYSMLTGFKVA